MTPVSLLLWETMEPESRGLTQDLGQPAGRLAQAGLLNHLKNVWASLKSLELAIPFPYPR